MKHPKALVCAAALLFACAPLARAAVDPSAFEPPAKLLAGELLAAQRSWAAARSSEPWALELSGFEPAALRPEAAAALRLFWGALVDALGRPEDGSLLLPSAWDKAPEASASAAISRLGGWADETAAGLRVQALLTERGTGRLLFSRRLDLIAGVPPAGAPPPVGEPAAEPTPAAPRTIPPAAERRRRWTLGAGGGPLIGDGYGYQAAVTLAKEGSPWSFLLDFAKFPQQSRFQEAPGTRLIPGGGGTVRGVLTDTLDTRALRVFGRRSYRVPARLRDAPRGWLIPEELFAQGGVGLHFNRLREWFVEIGAAGARVSFAEKIGTVVDLAPAFGGGAGFALPWKLRLELTGIYTPPTNRLGITGLGFDGLKLGVLVSHPLAAWGGR